MEYIYNQRYGQLTYLTDGCIFVAENVFFTRNPVFTTFVSETKR